MSRHKRVLVAGHDLKFFRPIMEALVGQGWTLAEDKWVRHTRHNPFRSHTLLLKADVIFCEWGLGNAVWFSKRKRPGQKLLVRVHAQELRTEFLSLIDESAVDYFIFVSEHIRDEAVRRNLVPSEKSVVIPNAVDVDAFTLAKVPGAQFNIALVGYLPMAKRMDLALDILEQLRSVDERFRLVLKGKSPQQLPWIRRRPDELEYFETQCRRIQQTPALLDGVEFSRFTPNMPTFFQGVGHILSVSDNEAFHLALAEGAASGALPHILRWKGASSLYPDSWISDRADGIASNILAAGHLPDRAARNYIKSRYDLAVVAEEIESLMLA